MKVLYVIFILGAMFLAVLGLSMNGEEFWLSLILVAVLFVAFEVRRLADRIKVRHGKTDDAPALGKSGSQGS